MSAPADPRKFSDEEVRRIFSDATERQEAAERATEGADGGTTGLTLSELQEIGSEAGILPEHVADAAARLQLGGDPGTDSGPHELAVTRSLPERISEEAWEVMVRKLRDTFGVVGISTRLGSVREWSSSNHLGEGPVRVHVEETSFGSRLSLRQNYGGLRKELAISAGFLALFSIFLCLLFFFGSFEREVWALPAVFAVLSGGLGASARFGSRILQGRRATQFERILEEVETAVRRFPAPPDPGREPRTEPGSEPRTEPGRLGAGGSRGWQRASGTFILSHRSSGPQPTLRRDRVPWSPRKARHDMISFRSATLGVALSLLVASPAAAQDGPRVFVSVDMEGIGGIGTGRMTNSGGGKDYSLGRELMTAEVNTVVRELFAAGASHVLVNDSHGDMQNVLHTQLDPRVEYIQGNTKPLGMVQGLDGSYDAAVFLGYHARAGTEGGFLAHTGSGSVKGLWLNGTEVGEGGMNAYFAGAHGVPVILAAGDSVFAVQFGALTGARTVVTKTAIGSAVARLLHPEVVRERLANGTREAMAALSDAQPIDAGGQVTVRARFATTTRADILEAVPGMRRVDGTTVEYDAANMTEAYALIRLMYKYISW